MTEEIFKYKIINDIVVLSEKDGTFVKRIQKDGEIYWSFESGYKISIESYKRLEKSYKYHIRNKKLKRILSKT